MISAVLIVRDEAPVLGACLDSLAGIDEIVVCDTGSTDATVRIAEAHGAKVAHFTWVDDFAAARNFAKAHASGDWILSIDADEALMAGNPDPLDAIRAAISPDLDGILVDLWNGAGERCRVPRVFRRCLHWQGIVHEVVSPARVAPVAATIRYGRSPAHDADPGRGLRLCAKAAQVEGTPRAWYYLGRELWYAARHVEAVAAFDRCLLLSMWKPERADAYLLRARCLWQLQRGDEARDACLAALNLNANFAEAARLMADMSWPENAGQWRALAAAASNAGVLFVRNP